MVCLPDARPPEGMRLYAIGDVHGCLEDLIAVHHWIEADLSARPAADWRVVHTGDLIDRGPDIPGVLDYLGERIAGDARFCSVRGNHDQYLLDFMADPLCQSFSGWSRYGGAITQAAYGARGLAGPDASTSERFDLHDKLKSNVPQRHLDLLESLPRTLRFGDYFFVHAGVRPGIALDAQDPHDLIWIREPFLSAGGDHGAVIVHGHTVADSIEARPNRIGVDTGCVFGNRLSCVVLEGNEVAELRADGPAPLMLSA